jgi:hypothetical protein
VIVTTRLSRVLLLMVAIATPARAAEFVSTWKAPGAGAIDFAGRKVAAVLISDDQDLRMSVEEAMVRELTTRGAMGVAGYRIIPRELLADKAAAQQWFERTGVAGLVVLRPVKTETEKVYSSLVWSSGYYNYAWDYWGAGWANVYPIGEARLQHTITVEILLFDLSKGAPVWAAASQSTDPKNVQSYINDLAVDVIKQLERERLVTKRR